MNKKEDSLIKNFPSQIEHSLYLANYLKFKNINKILVCGMGGSAIPGDILRDYIKNIPIFISKGYDIPNIINTKTLIFIISYSGNTEETISMYKKAKRKKAKMVIITSDGKLGKIAKNDLVLIPQGLPPRFALAYLFFPILTILQNSKLIKNQKRYLQKTIKTLKKIDFKKPKALAMKLKKKTIIIYASNNYKAVAERWKTQFNETSKAQAFYNVFSELDHNEIEAFSKIRKNFEVIILRDKKDRYKIKKRIKLTEKIIKKSVHINEVWLKGDSHLTKIFYGIYFGDLTSYYLALLNKVDPLKVTLIEKLKKKLSKSKTTK